MLSLIRSSVVIGVGAVILTASCSTPAQTPPPKYSVVTIEAKPGMSGQLDEFIKKFRDAVEKNKGPQRWLASSSMSGNDVRTITVPFGTFEEFTKAEGNPLATAYGEQEAARLLGLLQTSVASESTTIYVGRPDLSRPRPAGGATPVAVLFVDYNVRAGKEAQFEANTKKFIEAANAKTQDMFWEMRQRAFGPGNGPGYRVVVTFLAWADLDKPLKPLQQTLLEHFGAEEAARLAASNIDAIQGVNQRLNRVRADLGRPPVAN